jgi:hypothetical protein
MIYAAQSAGTQGTLATVLEKRTPHSDVRIKVVGTIQGGGAEPDGTARNPTLQVKLQKDIHFFDRDEKNSITDIAMGYGGIGNFTLISPFTYPKVDYIFRARCNILPEEVLSDPLWKEIVLSRKRDLPFDWTRIKEKNGKVERLWRDLK